MADSLNPLDDERFQDVSAAAQGDEDNPSAAAASSEEDEASEDHWEPLGSNGYHTLSGPLTSLGTATTLKGRNAATASRQKKTLPVVLSIVGVVVILGCLGAGALVMMRLVSLQSSLNSPQTTIDTFYSALHVNDYQTAYNQLSSDFQKRYAFPSFRAAFELSGTLESYQVSNLQTQSSQASATVKVTLVKGDGGITVDEIKSVQLVQEDGDWKIDRVNPTMSIVIWSARAGPEWRLMAYATCRCGD